MNGRHHGAWFGALSAVACVCAVSVPSRADMPSGAVDLPALASLAKDGSTDAQWKLGTLYWSGFGVTQDYLAARRWLQAAADQGLAAAQCELGLLYQTSTYADNAPQDIPKALFWYTIAADQNDGCGQFGLAMLTDSGQGTAADSAKAASLYAKAADHGYALDQASFPLQQLFAHCLHFARELSGARE